MKKGLPLISHVLWILIFVFGLNADSQDRKTEIREPIKKEQLKSPSSQETMTQTVPAQLLEPEVQEEDTEEKGNAIVPPPVEQEKVTPEPRVEKPAQEAPVQQTPPVTSKPKIQVVTPRPEAAPQDEVVNLQAEMDIRDMIQTISEITGETFILDESVKGKQVTIITPRGGFKERNAIRLFEAILDLNGFTIVRKNGVNKVIQKRDIKSDTIPTEFGTRFGSPSDRFVTRLIPLKNANAADIATTLKPLVSKDGDILVYPGLNTLIVIDSVSNINKILEIVDSIDLETVVEFIKIEHSEVEDVADKLVNIFGGTVSAPAVTAPDRQAAARTPRNVPAPSGGGSAGGQGTLSGFKVIPDERTKSLIVIAYPEDMPKIKAIIKKLDVEIDEPEQGIYVLRLQNADAEQVVSVISSLIGGGGGVGGSYGSSYGYGSSTSRYGSSGGFGRRSQTNSSFGRSSSFGSSFQGRQNTGTSGSFGAFGQQGSGIQRDQDGQGLTSTVVAQAEGLRVTADPATNSIIIISSRKDYESLKEVIDQLDIRRKQVYVEAAILEMSLEKLKSLGANFSLGAIINDDNIGFGGTALPGIPSLLGAAASSSSLISAVGSISGLFLGVIGDTVDPDGSGPIPPIPSFSALFQALSSLTDVNVLSTPSLLTTDNEQAEIIVADVIPFPTGSTVAETGVTVQTIERQPVGIRLAITPQISEGDFLSLNITTEVSAVRDAPAGLNTAQFGIATTTRTADSSVVVKNGQTIVIGGLVQDRESTLESKVPLFGDIPVLGNLFKFKRKTSSKINLMILLTPRIVENETQMQKILEERQRQNMLMQQKDFK